MEKEKIINFTMKSGRVLQGAILTNGECIEKILENLNKTFCKSFVAFINPRNRKSYIVLTVSEIESFEVYD